MTAKEQSHAKHGPRGLAVTRGELYAYILFAARKRFRDRVVDVEEAARAVRVQMLGRHHGTLNENVKVTRALVTPIGRLKYSHARFDRQGKFKEAARSRVAAVAATITDRVGALGGEIVVALRLHLSDMHDVARSLGDIAQARLFSNVSCLF